MMDEPLTAPSDFSCRGHYTFKPTHRPGFDKVGMMWHRLEDCPRDGPSALEVEAKP